jgi:hypothetical protein
MMNEEDEAFNEIERRAKQRKESVKAAVHTLTEYQRGYEDGAVDGMQKQMQSSVDKAVNAMAQRTWVGLTNEESEYIAGMPVDAFTRVLMTEAKLKEKNT